MNPGFPHRFNAHALSVALCALLLCSVGVSKDPAVARASAIEKMNEVDLSEQSLRYKIISSRALILHLQDILPSKGNPYYHMADFAARSGLESFKSAQATNSPWMNKTQPASWLPLKNGQVLTAQDFNDNDKAPVINYFAQFVATADVLEHKIQPILQKSIIVGSVAETAGLDADEKFKKTWSHIHFLQKKYSALLKSSEIGKSKLNLARKKVVLLMARGIVNGMNDHLETVTTQDNEKALKSFISGITDLSTLDVSEKQLKSKLAEFYGDSNPGYKKVKAALESVDLPDSGDIDGAEQSFEIAMRLEVGFDVLKVLLDEVKGW